MKWLKRLLYLIAFALLALLGTSVFGVYLYRGTPNWYRPRVATTQQTKDAANSADQKLLDLFSWAASAQAQQIRHIHGKAKPGEPSIGPRTVTFNEDEINSFFSTWHNPEKSALQQRISRYFTDGRVAFEDDAIILAGRSPEFGTLASAEFDPSLDAQGDLHLDFSALRAGRLPIPMSTVANHLRRLRGLLQQQLFLEQSSAKIDTALTANGPALAAAWLRLLLNALNDRPSPPILVIPFDMSNLRRGLPVKLTAIKVVEGEITLTLEPLDAPEDPQKLIELRD
ncbi:MAG TPA: hypothetical protein VHX86_05335 [Tepidisphaeraceae bacterium]|jgi:hypothetical protein|nr:hypothetical protein [Tepidisphaeraceae bacterium]